ncbi:MAG TPA: hypothetical protein VK121_07620 [Pseudogracilibacillus sp.]|nr:hypothetical protein [Pseudogracilibacillus sp.]
MKLIRLVIDNKEAVFGKHTLITSKKNTSGKTTFVRLILYSIGWDIPSTKRINFHKLITKIYFEVDKNIYQFVRHADEVQVFKNDNYIDKFSASEDMSILLSYYSSISNPQILNNLLGTFYFDQEEGWNWLTTGKVISGNRFNLGEFVEGLMDSDQSDLRDKVARNKAELRGYNLLRKNLSYKKSVSLSHANWNNFDKLNSELRTININISDINIKITTLNKAQKDNKQFISMISNMKLRIKTKSGDKELVTQDNICGFNEHQSFITARLAILKRNKAKYISQKAKIENELQKFTKLFNLQSQLDRFNESISKLDIDESNVEKIIKDIRKENSKLNKKISNSLSSNDYYSRIHARIVEFCKELKVEKYLDLQTDFIESLDLRKYTGAVLHLLSFAFHLAYLSILQEKSQEMYPIIIDSPYGNELTDENVNLMYGLLNKYFPNNQVITASINDIYNNFTVVDKKIEFVGSMMQSLDSIRDDT